MQILIRKQITSWLNYCQFCILIILPTITFTVFNYRFNRSILQNIQKRSSKEFCKKGILRNFAKFTGKYLCQSLFFNKGAGLRPATLLKKTMVQVFSREFCGISKNTLSYRTPLVAQNLILLADDSCIYKEFSGILDKIDK